MAKFLKHVGRIANTDRRCVVAFRELPDDPDNCLIIDTDALPDRFHDGVMSAVENTTAQETVEFYKYLERNSFIDGSNMLTALHNKGWLVKQPTDNVIMLPAPEQTIKLKDLNEQLRGLGFSVYTSEDKAPKKEPAQEVVENITPNVPPVTGQPEQVGQVLQNEDLAKNFLRQAETMMKEVENLKKQAYEMDPSLKPKRGRKKG
tara:strand:+ start:49 stop:660 length:612 start_codon:yes stop_codon:yes gene_type:complete